MAKRYSQPQSGSGAQIDWANPITKGLTSFGTQVGGVPFDFVAGKALTPSGSATSKPTVKGVAAYSPGGASDYWTGTGVYSAAGQNAVTIFALAYSDVSNTTRKRLMRIAGASGTVVSLDIADGTSNLYGGACKYVGGTFGIAGPLATNTPSIYASLVFARSGADLRFYIDGVNRTDVTSGLLSDDLFEASTTLNIAGQSTFPLSGGVACWGVWNRALSDAEIKSISDNPWQLFRAANSPIFVPVSGGGGSPYTLTADAGALAITGNAAGLSVNRTLTAGAGALSITGNAATLAFNRALIADTANVAITGNAASLVFTPVGGPTYTLPADSASIAISSAATSLVRGYNLALDAGAVSISASDAALIATRKLIADAYAAVIAGYDATLTYTPIVYPTIGRPASDTSNSGWTASTGSDLFAMVDEVTPDALDYIVTTATGSVCELALEQTAYPGTASQALKYRASSSTGNSLIVRLKNGATTIRTETQALTASDTEYTITLTSGEIAAITSGSLSVELESA